MKLDKFNKLRKILIVLVVGGVFASIYFDAALIALPIVLLGMIVMSFLKIQVKDAISDERMEDIDARASKTAFKILLPIIGFTSFALVIAPDGPFYYLKSLGVVLSYVTILGLIVYLGAYFYFKKKYGG